MAETEESQSSNSKRIAKNALMLYIRMFLSMIVGLYTSRVVLNTLGVEDYGIYGVVGGVVSMMGFLNASMSGATSRFITFELGKGNFQRLKDTFSSALIVHIGIALIVLIVAETVGLWFLNNKLVIPEERMYAAHWVYQLSILSAMLGITQVPYNACIIAHERMGVYAYIEILNVSLKLLIVYLLLIGDFDKLILYAILTLAVSIIIIMTYRIYCIRKFSECKFHWVWNKEILKPLLSFSGWDLYGNLGATLYNYGNSIVTNIFFGPILNAATNIATTIQNIAYSFSGNITTAYRPALIKLYAQKEYNLLQQEIINSLTTSFIILLIITIPLYFEIHYILSIWLKIVPPYTESICKFLIVLLFQKQIQLLLNILIHATGKIKLLSFVTGSLLMYSFILVYILYKITNNPLSAYYLFIILNSFSIIYTLYLVHNQMPQLSILIIIKKSIFKITPIIISSIPLYFIQREIDESFFRLGISFMTSTLLGCILSWFIILNSSQRNFISVKIKQHFNI